jgi:hypothetical protein
MRRLLESPRRRRRLAWSAGSLIVAVPLVFLGVHFSNAGSTEKPKGQVAGEEAFYRTPKHVRFTARDRHAVRKVLARFIETAVARKDVASSWDLAGPALRNGITRRQWARGEIPVVPYPVAKHGQGTWSLVQYSYRNEVGLEALLFPLRCSGYSMATVDTTLVRRHDGRWLVNYWMLTKFHGPGSTAPADSASALSEGAPNVHRLPGKKTGC